jgi:two-component system chemotaxis response regulator CheB
MQGVCKLVILAAPPLLNGYMDYFSKSPEVSLLYATANEKDVLAYLEKNPTNKNETAVLADYTQKSADIRFINEIKKMKLIIVTVVSNVNEGFDLLQRGADEMIVRRAKDGDGSTYFYRILHANIKKAIESADFARVIQNTPPPETVTGKIIAIGSSTGGTETVLDIVKSLPVNSPPVLLVQHMPPVFTKLFADRADTLCKINVREARDGDWLKNGLMLVAPGNYHMKLKTMNGKFCVACEQGEKVQGQCPSVDVLFDSVAQTAGLNAVGVILTGMGADGAKGLLNMKRRGAFTIGQDKETSIVYGMPRAAFELGAVDIQLPLGEIAGEVLTHAV